jgi:hypothetical protein
MTDARNRCGLTACSSRALRTMVLTSPVAPPAAEGSAVAACDHRAAGPVAGRLVDRQGDRDRHRDGLPLPALAAQGHHPVAALGLLAVLDPKAAGFADPQCVHGEELTQCPVPAAEPLGCGPELADLVALERVLLSVVDLR